MYGKRIQNVYSKTRDEILFTKGKLESKLQYLIEIIDETNLRLEVFISKIKNSLNTVDTIMFEERKLYDIIMQKMNVFKDTSDNSYFNTIVIQKLNIAYLKMIDRVVKEFYVIEKTAEDAFKEILEAEISNKKDYSNNPYYKDDENSEEIKNITNNNIPLSNRGIWYALNLSDDYLNNDNSLLVLNKITKKVSENFIDRITNGSKIHDVIIYHKNYGMIRYMTTGIQSDLSVHENETKQPIIPVNIKTFDNFQGQISERKRELNAYLNIKQEEYDGIDSNDYIELEKSSYFEDLSLSFRNTFDTDATVVHNGNLLVKINSIEPNFSNSLKQFTVKRINLNNSTETYDNDYITDLPRINTNVSSLEHQTRHRYKKDTISENFIDNNIDITNGFNVGDSFVKQYMTSSDFFMNINGPNQSVDILFKKPYLDISGVLNWKNMLISDPQTIYNSNIVSSVYNVKFKSDNYYLWDNYVYAILPYRTGVLPTKLYNFWNSDKNIDVENIKYIGDKAYIQYKDRFGNLILKEIDRFTDTSMDEDTPILYINDNYFSEDNNMSYYKQFEYQEYFDTCGLPYRHFGRIKFFGLNDKTIISSLTKLRESLTGNYWYTNLDKKSTLSNSANVSIDAVHKYNKEDNLFRIYVKEKIDELLKNDNIFKENIPIGSFIPVFNNETLYENDDNWIRCDGRVISKNIYSKLYEIIGDNYRGEYSGDVGLDEFVVPKFENIYLVTKDDGAGISPMGDRLIYDFKEDTMQHMSPIIEFNKLAMTSPSTGNYVSLFGTSGTTDGIDNMEKAKATTIKTSVKHTKGNDISCFYYMRGK